MADQNIALGVQVPDAMKSISGLLNFANQAQSLQSARQEYQRGGVALERERATLQPSIRSATAAADTAETGAKRALTQLNDEQANILLNETAALRTHPAVNSTAAAGTPEFEQAAADTIKELRAAQQRAIDKGVPADKAAWQMSHIIARADKPGGVKGILDTITRAQSGPGAQAAVLNAPLSTVNTGTEIKTAQLQPGAPGAVQPGATVAQTQVPPGAQETTERGPDGNSYIVTRTPSGAIVGTRPLGGNGGGAQPKMPVYSPGDQEAVPALETERTNARNAVMMAPEIQQNVRGILQELPAISTGALGSTLNRLFSGAGIAVKSAEERASAYDLVGKYLERNALQLAQSMGPHTNAGLDSVRASAGSTGYNPTAITKLAELLGATVEGAQLYQPGLEKAIAANPQRGVLTKREFDTAWGQNYDPRIMLLERAAKAGDAKAVNEIKGSLGAAGIAELRRKAQALQRLSAEGRL